MGTSKGWCPRDHSCSLRRGRVWQGQRKDNPPTTLGCLHAPHHTLMPAPWAQGTAVEARPAVGAARAMSVVQTSLAVPTVGVTGSGVPGVNVVTLAGPAQTPSGVPSWLRAPKVARGTAVTVGPWRDWGTCSCLRFLADYRSLIPNQKVHGLAQRAEDTIVTLRPTSWLTSSRSVIPPI